jgi:hypothetical protein
MRVGGGGPAIRVVDTARHLALQRARGLHPRKHGFDGNSTRQGKATTSIWTQSSDCSLCRNVGRCRNVGWPGFSTKPAKSPHFD